MKIRVNKEAGTREPKAFIDSRGNLILPNERNSLNTTIGRSGGCREGTLAWEEFKGCSWYNPLYEGDVITITL